MTEFIRSFEEVDTAMFYRLSGAMVQGEEVEITYYTPDVDLVKADPPALVMYRTTPFRDLERWDNELDFRDNRVYDSEGNLTELDIRTPPEPWSILYTVKTLYKYQMDGVALNDHMLRVFTRGDFITINNVNYSVDILSAGLWGSQYKDFGRVEDGERKFQETYSFRVNILLEMGDRKTVKTVQTVDATQVPQNL